jgi:hypothetical protein
LSPVQNSFLGSRGPPRMPISANALCSSDAAWRGKLGDNPVARASVSRHHLDTRSGGKRYVTRNRANVGGSTPLLRYIVSCNVIRQRPYRPGKVIVSASPFHLLSINPLDGQKAGAVAPQTAANFEESWLCTTPGRVGARGQRRGNLSRGVA